jgi:RNA polymerase sigma-70 factor (ECF subfamily)
MDANRIEATNLAAIPSAERADQVSDLTALAVAARAGAAGAVDRLWERTRPRAVRVALALGVPAQDVSDLVQDVLLAAHRGLRSFDDASGSFEAWLAAILVRRARNRARAARRRSWLLAAFRSAGRPDTSRTAPAIEQVEARLTLARLVDALTPSQREVVALYEIEDLSAEEAARVLGIEPSSVRSIARDARRKLTETAALESPVRKETRP